jgi:hypothetical protein
MKWIKAIDRLPGLHKENVQRMKQGGLITVGVPPDVLNRAMDTFTRGNDDTAIILLAIDMK